MSNKAEKPLSPADRRPSPQGRGSPPSQRKQEQARTEAEAGQRPPTPAPPEPQDNDHDEGSSTGYEDLAASIEGDPILKTVAQPAFALIMLLTLLLFWRGHNLPGGGFVGGAMTVCALLLHRIAWRGPATDFNFAALIPVGLATAFLTGLVPYLFSGYFLKSDFGYITTRLTGEFEWATAMLFDIGVFLLVIGGGMTIARELIDIDPQEKVEKRLEPEQRGVTSQRGGAPQGGLFDFQLTGDPMPEAGNPRDLSRATSRTKGGK